MNTKLMILTILAILATLAFAVDGRALAGCGSCEGDKPATQPKPEEEPAEPVSSVVGDRDLAGNNDDAFDEKINTYQIQISSANNDDAFDEKIDTYQIQISSANNDDAFDEKINTYQIQIS
jgi:flagellar basal body-associated protein FliL